MKELTRILLVIILLNIGLITKGQVVKDYKIIVILVSFNDLEFTTSREEVEDLFNQSGYSLNGHSGSVNDYFKASSSNKLNIQATVVGPYELGYTKKYYNSDAAFLERPLINHAVKAADKDVDYSAFDNDGDGYVDCVYVLYAGYSQDLSGDTEDMWPQTSKLQWYRSGPIDLDGVRINQYSCSSELMGNSIKIGTICHEISHVLGLPDTYDTDYQYSGGQAFHPGSWDVMASGLYNNNGANPPLWNALERSLLGYVDIEEGSIDNDYTLGELGQTGKAIRLNYNNDSNEYFILENRQQENFDSYLPGHGLIIYRVDDNKIKDWQEDSKNMLNANPSDLGFELIPANNNTSHYDSGQAFPGTKNKREFTDDTTPSSKSKSGNNLNKPLYRIKENNSTGNIMFHIGDTTNFVDIDTFSISIASKDSLKLYASFKSFGDSIIETGFVYSETNDSPDILSNKIVLTSSDNTIIGYIKNDKQYYIRPYVKTKNKISYGEMRASLRLKKTVNYSASATTAEFIVNWYNHDNISSKNIQYSQDGNVWSIAQDLDSIYKAQFLKPDTIFYYRPFIVSNQGDTLFDVIDSIWILPLKQSAESKNIKQTTATITAYFNNEEGVIVNGIICNNEVWITGVADTLTANIVNLYPNTSYTYYPFCVLWNGDTIKGSQQSLATLPVNNIIKSSATTTPTTSHITTYFGYQIVDVYWRTDTVYKGNDSGVYCGIIFNDSTIAIDHSDTLTVDITQLRPNTTYSYYPFLLINNKDSIIGNIQTFNTKTLEQFANCTTTQTTANITAYFHTDSGISENGVLFNDQVIASSEGDTVYATITNLSAGTKYSYYTFSVLWNGDTIKTEKYFTTKNITLSALDATNINKTVATINGHISWGDVPIDSINSMGFIFNDTDTLLVINTDGDFSYNLTNLDFNTTYKYKIFCYAYGKYYESYYDYYGYKTFKTLPFEYQGDVHQISTAEDLSLLAELINNNTGLYNEVLGRYTEANYKLMNDIYLDSSVTNNVIAIGKREKYGIYQGYPFRGTFDGNNHIIYNVNIEKLQDSCQGLFGYTMDAEIKNLGIANVNVVSKKYTGGMIGYAVNSKITNCYVNGGYLYAASYSGGFMGYQDKGDNSIITSCYNTCQVQGNNYIGGLVGYSNQGVVRNSYVAAPVIGLGETAIGAIIGGANDVLTYNFYFSTTTTGQNKAIGLVVSKKSGTTDTKAGEGKTDEEMKTDEFVTLLNTSLSAPAFKKDYEIELNNGFPILGWQQGIELNVSTSFATDITDNSATLNGKVETDSKNISSQGFQYKKEYDTEYTTIEAEGEEISYTVTNLEKETQYTYHAFAAIGNDTVFGAEIVFKTLKDSGIDEIDNGNSLQIYPNPAHDVITLDLGHLTLDKNETVSIVNNSGKVVYKSNVQSPKFKINVSKFEAGVYYINVGKFTQPLIIE
ncbi:MAG: M6 family metalloprotease domain-containing protein [Bacteroidales bacterium]|nr:M6 family metalloprotease domain-containing protein [Bacteroidales bacterium]